MQIKNNADINCSVMTSLIFSKHVNLKISGNLIEIVNIKREKFSKRVEEFLWNSGKIRLMIMLKVKKAGI